MKAAMGAMAALFVATGCLPDDERPPPGELSIVAEASEATRDGVVDDDGAVYTFDLAALTLGTYLIGDDVCAPYSFTYYDWLVDYTQPGPHKIGLLFGLGDCQAGYDSFAPDEVTVPGTGVGAGLAATMEDANLYVEGRAERGDDEVAFRFRVYWPGALAACRAVEGSPAPIVTSLESGDERELALTIRFEEVVSVFTFDELLQSDLDGDGVVTEPELNIISPGTDVVGEGLYAPAISHVVTARDGWVCPTTELY